MVANNKRIEVRVPKLLVPNRPLSVPVQALDRELSSMYAHYSLLLDDIHGICYVTPHYKYSSRFSICLNCCTDNCWMRKLGARACTVKHKVMKGEI